MDVGIVATFPSRERDGGDGLRRQVDELAYGGVTGVLRRAAEMAEGWAR